MSDRARLADLFLDGTEWAGAARTPLAEDASTRRYVRLRLAGGRSAVLMDAPPGQGQDVAPFLKIAAHLARTGFSAPAILKSDSAVGLVLLEDLGDAVFARLIDRHPAMERPLYEAAVDLLAGLHRVPPAAGLNVFTPRTLAEQVAPVFDWYVAGIAGPVADGGRTAFQAGLETVLSALLTAPPVMILRDFHAENLIWLPGRTGSARVGLLDFQDALIGDPSYDLVSLLQDARRDVPHDLAQAMIRRFTAATGADPDAFLASYCATGAQRQLRILGIFARLSLHFGKVRYVDLIPRVWGHLMTCLQHPDLAAVKTLADGMLPPPTPGNLQILRDKCATIPTP